MGGLVTSRAFRFFASLLRAGGQRFAGGRLFDRHGAHLCRNPLNLLATI